MGRRCAGLLLAALWGLFCLPAVPAGAGGAVPDYIAVNPRGVARNQSTEPARLVYTVEVFSLTTDAPAGSLTDVISCSTSTPPPCLVLDVVTTYRLPDGDIVNHGQWSAVPEPARPGFILAAARPATDTIVSGTGRFAGASGRANGWGSIDARNFPAELVYDMFTIIHLGAGHADVLGSTEARYGSAPGRPGSPGFLSQYFQSDGLNQSSEPGGFLATAQLFSLASARQAGTAVDDVSCSLAAPPPCLVLDVITTFRFPEGEITARSALSLVPDPQRPGFALINTRPDRDTIISATGGFAGRTGRLFISGRIDMQRFPVQAPYEGVSLIRFN